MLSDIKAPASPYLKIVSRYLTASAFILSTFVLAGWVLDIEILKRGIATAAAMNPLSMICFFFCTISLWIQQNENATEKQLRNAKTLALSVCVIGFMKIIFMIARMDFIDTIFFHDRLWDPVRNDYGRMPPNAAFCFFLIGLSLFWLDKEYMGRRRPAQYFSIFIMFVAMLSLYGYAYGVKYLYGITHFSPMSFFAGLNFLLLSIAILFSRPDKGSMAIIIGDTSAEITLLRLAAFIIPLGLGWLKLRGEKLGYYSTEFGTALFAVITYALAMFLLGRRSVVNYKLRAMRKESELIMRENARKLQSILDHSPTTIYIKKLNGEYELVNKQFEKIFQVGQEQVVGKVDHEIFSGEIATAFTGGDFEVKEKLQTVYAEEEFPMKGHDPAWFLSVKFPLTDAEGNIHSICGIATDITDRKRAEEEINRTNHFLNAILENIPDMIFVKDVKELRFVRFNKAGENLLGYSREDLIGKNDYDFFPKDQADFFINKDREVINKKELLDIPEEPIDTAKGKRWLHTKKITLCDEQGNPLYLLGISEDITERKNADQILRINEQLLRRIVDMVSDEISNLKDDSEKKRLDDILNDIKEKYKQLDSMTGK